MFVCLLCLQFLSQLLRPSILTLSLTDDILVPCAYADADKELKFSVNQDGRYVAEAVPRQVGIRAGSIVQGVVRDGHVADDVEPLVSKDQKNRTLTLGELAKKHKINLEADTLVMEKKARYCTHLCRVDTKDYGLPQTRNRKVCCFVASSEVWRLCVQFHLT